MSQVARQGERAIACGKVVEEHSNATASATHVRNVVERDRGIGETDDEDLGDRTHRPRTRLYGGHERASSAIGIVVMSYGQDARVAIQMIWMP